ncbi:MAG: tail fiber domain-containing protein [Bacteroidales bacterium]|jgi:hypothetical protein
MKRFTFFFVWAIMATSLFAQEVPQGFTYQAILRDNSGAIIANTKVTVELSLLDRYGSPQWVEKHTVTTNQFGLIALTVGKGERIRGTVSKFEEIDWTTEPVYINNTIIHNSERIDLGISEIWAVPYSLVADRALSLDGDLNKLNIVEDINGANEEALFEVRNNTGQTVFAVYNEGVEVYFDDTDKKGIKGSFAVRGFGSGKANENNYMILSSDSARIYINNDETDKGIKGSFAVRGFGSGKADETNYMILSNDSARIYINNDESAKGIKGSFAVKGFGSTIKGDNASYFDINMDETSSIIDPAENRILWYPLSNAFLAGKILITDTANVGENSFVVGYESNAGGDYSQAMGYRAYANGSSSTSIGQNSRAEGDNSYAIGQGAQATAPMSYALGRGAIASGTGSFAFGSAGIDSLGNPTDYVQASGSNSVAIGQGARAMFEGSIAIGVGDSATSWYAVALGYQTSSSGYSSFTAGSKTKATGSFSTALGYESIASGLASTTLGTYTEATGIFSTALGLTSTASGMVSTALGSYTEATGSYSTALGFGSTANGRASTALGSYTEATGDYSTALGSFTTASGELSIAAGKFSEAKGNISTAIGEFAMASGDRSMALGNYVTANSYAETVFGMYNTYYAAESDSSYVDNDRLFVIGNGTSYNQPSDALVVLKKGNIGIGNPEQEILEQYSLAVGATDRGLHVQTNGSSGYNTYSVNSLANGGDISYAFRGTSSGALTENYGASVVSYGSGTTNCGAYTAAYSGSNNYGTYARASGGSINCGIYAEAFGGSTNYAGYFSGDVKVTGEIITSSDSRLKTDIVNIENPLDKIMSLNGVSYNWNSEEFPERHFDDRTHIGVIAQNVEKVLPELVYTDENGYKSVSYEKLTPVLIEAVKEQQSEIEALKSENEELINRIKAIEKLLNL